MEIKAIHNICIKKSSININQMKNERVTFTGLKDHATRCMFVFDLDGTFAQGAREELNEIVKISKQRNANLIYATGRNKKEVEKLQQKLADKGVTLPTPDYLICNNGQFLYENIGGILVKNTEYEAQLKASTNFDSKKVLEIMTELAHSPKYKLTPERLSALRRLNNYEQIKANDPTFFDSSISHYEWNASEFMSEYFVSSDVNLSELKKDIKSELSRLGIKTKFIENLYSKPIMDACNEGILLQSHPIRRHVDGSMTALFLCPADKADGVKYLKKQLNVPFNEILIAGNDDNDISMAQLSKRGAYFICLNNASAKLKLVSNLLKNSINTLFFTKNDGANGILEGMSDILR